MGDASVFSVDGDGITEAVKLYEPTGDFGVGTDTQPISEIFDPRA